MLAWLHKLFSTDEPRTSRLSAEEIEQHIDLAIKEFDSRIALIPGYRKKLSPAVESALLYAESLIERIPGPVDVNVKAFGADPRVNAYFGSPEKLEHLFSHSTEFRAFSDQPVQANLEYIYVLMVMTRHRKTRPGHALRGDMVQSDVMQDVVYFSDHYLAKPAESEFDVRRDLRERAFQHLLSESVQKVALHSKEKADMERQKVHLKMEIKTRHAERSDLDFLHEKSSDVATGDLYSRQLAEIEQKLAKLRQRLETINDYLDLLIDVLNHSPDYCGLESHEDCLNRINVVVDEDAGHQVPYANIRIGKTRRCGVIVRYPRKELVETSRIASRLHSLYR